MAEGWNSYYFILLAGFLALGFPLTFGFLGWISSSFRFSRPISNRKRPEGLPTAVSANKIENQDGRFHSRYFLALNSSVILLVLALVLIPCVAAFRELLLEDGGYLVEIVIASTGLILLVSLIYSSRKGDLGWVWSYRNEKEED